MLHGRAKNLLQIDVHRQTCKRQDKNNDCNGTDNQIEMKQNVVLRIAINGQTKIDKENEQAKIKKNDHIRKLRHRTDERTEEHSLLLQWTSRAVLTLINLMNEINKKQTD